eukprot:5622657-Pleurochrysis_carterae.AAC.1
MDLSLWFASASGDPGDAGGRGEFEALQAADDEAVPEPVEDRGAGGRPAGVGPARPRVPHPQAGRQPLPRAVLLAASPLLAKGAAGSQRRRPPSTPQPRSVSVCARVCPLSWR